MDFRVWLNFVQYNNLSIAGPECIRRALKYCVLNWSALIHTVCPFHNLFFTIYFLQFLQSDDDFSKFTFEKFYIPTYVLNLKILFTLLVSDFVKSKLVNGHSVLHSLPKLSSAVCKVSNWTKSNLPPSCQGFPTNIRWDKTSKVPKCTHVFGKMRICSIVYVGILTINKETFKTYEIVRWNF